MASSVNSMPAANSASGNPVNVSSQNPSARPSLKSTAHSKAVDGARRQPGGSMDGGQRRSNSQKAWTQGTNPITQKPSFSQQNGNMPHNKQSPSPRPVKESNTSDSHAHDRLVFLFTSFIGLNATVTTKNGDRFTGIFSSSTLETSESSFLLKMVQRSFKHDPQRPNGVSEAAIPFLGSGADHTMAFDVKDVVDIAIPNVSTADVTAKGSNGASSGFRTDTDISGNFAVREKTLKRWEPAADTEVDMSLESSNTTGWDQFEANARLFGATSSYDENIYTTRIDRSDPTYKRKEADAARIAREIEGTDVENPHIREERGLVPNDSGEQDEEAKYSGVHRDEKNFPPLASGQPNKYTPPARRQPVVQSATTGPSAKQAATAAANAAPGPTRPKPSVPAQVAQDKQPQPQQTAPKVAAETEQKPVSDKHAPPATSGPKRAAAENATANVETEVLDHFRQFANSEKLKMQERRRNQASYDRTIKLNELMKFSHSFKLATPVPKDLVPILAKDPHKQEEIVHKVHHETEEKVPSKATPVTAEQKPPTRGPGPTRYDSGTVPAPSQPDRQNFSRGRQMHPPTGPQGGRLPHQGMHAGRGGTGMLSHRLADNLQQRKGTPMGPVPAPLPIHGGRIPPSGPAGDQSGVSSPGKAQTPMSASSTKFNVKAMEFKPNPAANTFTPGASAVSSPQPFRGRSFSRAPSPSSFFGAKKPRPITERPSVNDQFNPIKRMKSESAGQPEKDYSFNGGIPPAYKTLPTWDVPAGNEEKSYQQFFRPPDSVPSIAPQSRSASNPQAPPQPQVPYFQQPNPGMPPASGPPHGPQHVPPHQPHGSGPHFDDHRMQMSASTPQVFPSPRLQQSHMGYPSPMPPHAQLAFNQPMPQFYMNQGGPQPPHMRQYPGAPQFVGPQTTMGAPMMVQQPSGGPYMGMPQGMPPYTPQMQMYSPSPGHAYPAPPQPHSGYPSPSRGAPMMMHQNSQPGQPPQPVMFMGPAQQGQSVYPPQQPGHMPPVRNNYPQQPHFSSSPHQGHHYPPNQRRTPSNNFSQVPQQMPPQAAQGPPPSTSVSHGPDAADEIK